MCSILNAIYPPPKPVDKGRGRCTFILLVLTTFLTLNVFAAEEKTLKTKYTTIHYTQDKDLSLFLWRLKGFNVIADISVAQHSIDAIVEQVEMLLDMYPEGFHIDIFLFPEYKGGLVAYYSHKDRSITAYADRITDGILAHEIAHAIINAYFPIPPPKKIQEILCQYVDRHLWEGYR